MSLEEGRLSRADHSTITSLFRTVARREGRRIEKRGTSAVARAQWRHLPDQLQNAIIDAGRSYDPTVGDPEVGSMHTHGAAMVFGFAVGTSFGRKLLSGRATRSAYYTDLDQLLKGHVVRDEFSQANADATLHRAAGDFTQMIHDDIEPGLVVLKKPLYDMDGNNYAYDYHARALYSRTVGYAAAVAVNRHVISLMELRQDTIRRRFGFDSAYSDIRSQADALTDPAVLGGISVEMLMDPSATTLPIEEPPHTEE